MSNRHSTATPSAPLPVGEAADMARRLVAAYRDGNYGEGGRVAVGASLDYRLAATLISYLALSIAEAELAAEAAMDGRQ